MASNFRHTIHITNIPWTIGRHQLALYFSQYGCVYDTQIRFDKKTGLHQGYGSVTFLKKEILNSVLSHKHSLEGKDLILSIRKYGEIDLNNNN